MATFYAGIINYYGLGSKISMLPDKGWVRNILPFDVGNYKMTLEIFPEIIAYKAKVKSKIHTGNIAIEGIRSYQEGFNAVSDLCNLLSFASMSQVVPFMFSFKDTWKRIHVHGTAMHFRPVFDIMDAASVKAFIESSWKYYRLLKNVRKLSVVIEMMTISTLPDIPIETRLLQLLTTFENLKFTYAKSKRYPFFNGYFRIANDPSQNLNKAKRLSFESLLNCMFTDVNMKISLRPIVSLRNEIMHSGLSRLHFKTLSKRHDKCHDILREYILRLLNFKGGYLRYSSACRSLDHIK